MFWPKTNKQKVIAPFWTDLDVVEDSRLWYHVYYKYDRLDSNPTRTQNIMDRAEQAIKDTYTALEFTPVLVLIVTWEKFIPYNGDQDTRSEVT